ncbi:MAG: protein kinase [Myxococcales bacterium]|nr:protein kinase [Myxococcales bacterium]
MSDDKENPDRQIPQDLLATAVSDHASPGEEPSCDAGGVIPIEQTGRYTIRGLKGVGGQARVLVAVDSRLGREVALKEMLPLEEAEKGGPAKSTLGLRLSRFLREARLTGALEHPNIVPVHEVGRRYDGTFFYTMRLVHGQTMAVKLAQCKNLSERLELLGSFWDICNAMAFSHRRGVVHRDLKPENVMVGEFGETVVLDWGIAKVKGQTDARAADLDRVLQALGDTGAQEQTAAGVAVGTPVAMSPEQARGRVDEIDERSDVWALGVMLYEILTGRKPFEGANARETLKKIVGEELVPVRARCREAPAELAAIAEKALQKDPARRYPDAASMAEDVKAFMTGGRVRAHAYSSWDLLRRFIARNRAAVAAASVALLAVIAALVFVFFAYRDESRAREREHLERLRAHYHLAQAFTQQASRLADEKKLLSARVFAAAALRENPANPKGRVFDARFEESVPDSNRTAVEAFSLVYRTDHRQVSGLRQNILLGESVTSVAFSPDGRRLLTADLGGEIGVYPVAGGEAEFRVKAHEGQVGAAVFAPGGTIIGSAGRDGTVKLWSLGRREPLRVLRAEERFMSLAFSPDGRRVAAGAESGRIRVFDLDAGGELWQGAHENQVWGLEFSPDGALLASGSWDKTVILWDAQDGARRATLAGHTDSVNRIAFAPDGRRLASAAYDKTVRVWSIPDGKLLGVLEGHADSVHQAVWSRDGRVLATASMDGSAGLWDATGFKSLFRLDVSRHSVSCAALSPDGTGLATGGFDRQVRLWGLAGDDGLRRLRHSEWVYGIAFSRDGTRVATASWDRTARLWEWPSLRLLKTFSGHTDGLYAVDLSPDGRRLLTAGFDKRARLWETGNGREIRVLDRHSDALYAARFSPDGKFIATAGKDHVVHLWDGQSGEHLFSFDEPTQPIHQLSFSPDGKRLVCGSQDRKTRIYDLTQRKLVAELEGHQDWISGVAFSPDGKHLATAGKDARIVLWDAVSLRPLRTLTGHRQWINRVSFSPDGRFLTSAGDDSLCFVWEVESGRPLLVLRATGGVTESVFSPDGKWLAVTDYDAATLYPIDFSAPPVDAEELLKDAERRAGLVLDGFELAPPGASSF